MLVPGVEHHPRGMLSLGSKWQQDCEQLPAATGPDLPCPGWTLDWGDRH
jgi:hypothetical protein